MNFVLFGLILCEFIIVFLVSVQWLNIFVLLISVGGWFGFSGGLY